MRNILIGIILLAFLSVARGGAYDEILDSAHRSDTAAVVDLLRRGMDVNTADSTGTTLLMIAARNGNMELLGFLLENGAGVNRRNQFGDTATLLAAIKGHLAALQKLNSHGGALEPAGWTTLHYAVFGQNPDVLAWVIEQKVKLDYRAPNGQTALMLAAKLGNREFVRLLVDADADMDLADFEGQTAIGLARKGGHTEVAAYLKSVGAVE